MYTPPPVAVVEVTAVTVLTRNVVAEVTLYTIWLSKPVSLAALVSVVAATTELRNGTKPPVVPPPVVAEEPWAMVLLEATVRKIGHGLTI
jgi:hypothetical protein